MEHRQRRASFYVEALLLIVVFIVITLILTRVFGAARRESAEARDLTNAVCLAQNAAETVSASHDRDELIRLLDQADNADEWESGACARYNTDLLPDAAGDYIVNITWEQEKDTLPSMVYSSIVVQRSGRTLYDLSTAVYVQDEGGGRR